MGVLIERVWWQAGDLHVLREDGLRLVLRKATLDDEAHGVTEGEPLPDDVWKRRGWTVLDGDASVGSVGAPATDALTDEDVQAWEQEWRGGGR